MFLIKLALRNLTRHKRRTLITAAVIAFGLFTYLVIDSLLVGMEQISFDNIIKLKTGHMKVVNEAYWAERKELPLDHLVYYDSELQDLINQTPNYRSQAPRLEFSARLNNGVEELVVNAIGIDPQAEPEVFTTDESITEGTYFNESGNSVVMGKDLADLMGLKAGDFMRLIIRTKDGTFNTIDGTIAGLVQTGHPEINQSTVFVPLTIAQQSLNAPGLVSEVAIRLDHRRGSEDATEELSQLLAQNRPELTAKHWKESAQSLIAMSKAGNIENQVIISIILILAAVGIINTIILSAIERLEETGMMKAMGMKEIEIIIVYVIESIGIGLIGGIFGCILGAFGVWALNTYGIDFAWFGLEDMNIGFPISGRFYGVWELRSFIFVFFFGAVVALFSSILPARWAAKKDPIDAIYHR